MSIAALGLPTEFWWDAYQTSNYITVRLPTKTKKGYITPFECLTGQVPDLKHLCVWFVKCICVCQRISREKIGG